MESLQYKNLSFTAWDIGAKDKMVSEHNYCMDIEFIC